MSTLDVTRIGWLKPADALTLAVFFGTLYIAVQIASAIYEASFGPLSKFPGPKLRAFSVIPKIVTIFRGDEHTDIYALHKKYGPVVRVGPRELSFAGGAKAWKDIYGFRKAGQATITKSQRFYQKPINGVPGLILADDPTHSRQRKTVSHAFSDKSLRELEPMLKKWAEKMKLKLSERSAGQSAIDMLKYYNCTTFDIMGDLSFAEGLNMLDDGEYSPWVKTIFGSIKRGSELRAIQLWAPWVRWLIGTVLARNKTLRQKQLEHWDYTTKRVNRRLEREPDHPDLWTKILEKSHGPDALSIDEHHSIGSLFMVAGTETTATALSGTTFFLLQNPDVLARLTKEIRSAYTSFEDISLDSLARLPYLHAVLKEGLRMYPPVPATLLRTVPKGGVVLDGEFVPEDVDVGVHVYATQKLDTNFKDPERFHPGRWLGDPEYANDQLDAVEPFSVGPRNCLGKNLAWHELRLLLATVMLEFDLSLSAESEDWVNRQKTYVLWEKLPLMCTLTPVAA